VARRRAASDLSMRIERITHSRRQSAANEPGLIRDDPTGRLSAHLQREIDVARRLQKALKLIAREGDLERWEEAFARWRKQCGDLLRHEFEREAADEFYRGTALPAFQPTRWEEATRATEKSMAEMIELLVTLRHTLGRRDGAAP
jgi:hypothetical protein